MTRRFGVKDSSPYNSGHAVYGLVLDGFVAAVVLAACFDFAGVWMASAAVLWFGEFMSQFQCVTTKLRHGGTYGDRPRCYRVDRRSTMD